MKDYILLCWSKFNYYRNISDYVSSSNLRFLINFFSGDYRSDDKNLFSRTISYYDSSFVYNDFQNKTFCIGCSEWELDEEVDAPSREEFHDYVNETNSCKISYDNFINLAENLMIMKKKPKQFAIIYRDNFDWIDCKGFDTKELMEDFVKNYKDEVVH
ncbi:MAG: hypothetical protein ACXWL2_05305 [Candidatus Chromulinivorax sp.]